MFHLSGENIKCMCPLDFPSLRMRFQCFILCESVFLLKVVELYQGQCHEILILALKDCECTANHNGKWLWSYFELHTEILSHKQIIKEVKKKNNNFNLHLILLIEIALL